MSVNGGCHVVQRGFQTDGRDRLGDNFSGQWPDGVYAQNFAVFRFGDHFNEALVIAENGGFAVGKEGKLSGLDLQPGICLLYTSRCV